MGITTGTHAGAVLSVVADAAHTAENLLVKKGTADNSIAVNGVADRPLGICLDKPDAAGDVVGLQLLCLGMDRTQNVVASGVIAVGDTVVAAANGKVQKLPDDNGTYYRVGIALEAAAADGDPIEIAPEIPSAVVVSG